MPADGNTALVDPDVLPLLRDLTAAEDRLESDLERILKAWERDKRVPKGAEADVAQFLYQRLLAMQTCAVAQLHASLRLFEAKDANTFAADRVDWARTRGAELARGITAESRQRVASIVASAAETGAGPSTIRREIQGEVPGIGGRTPRQRAAMIARTELHNAATYAQEREALRLQARGARLVKVWTATRDNRTRPTHRAANGQTRPLNEPFIVGGSAMMRPGDGPAKEVVNCRCLCRVLPEGFEGEDRLRREQAARLAAPDPMNRDEGDPTKPAPVRLPVDQDLLQTMRADAVAPNANAAPPPVTDDPVRAFAAGRRWVLSKGLATNREHLAAWDWKTGVTLTTNGTASSVPLPPAMRSGATGRSVIVLHNHPTTTPHDIPLSIADVEIAMRKRVESMTALGNQGSIFTARALPGFTPRLMKRIDSGAYEDALALMPETWPEDDQIAVVQQGLNLALARYGVIDYVASMTGVTRRFFEREAELVAKAQGIFEGVLEKARLKPLAEAKGATDGPDDITTIHEPPRGLSDKDLIARVRELRTLEAKGEPGVENALRVGEFFLKRRKLTA